MTITRLKFERFTAFENLEFQPSPGINILVGANGTGKTHLMKAAYAACDVSKTGGSFAEKLINTFMPSGRSIGRLVKRRNRSVRGAIHIFRNRRYIRASFSNHATVPDSVRVTGAKGWAAEPVESVYIPVKEMLANAPGFRSLYAQREIHFEEVYADILDRAYRPSLRGPADISRKKLLNILRKVIDGRIVEKNEEFYHHSKQ
ncbi:MAG: AAA family ATPase, partial [Rhodospirillaceae bacterium]|nr:AAA family ATPase [Rhodospirillaceae bacterium]